MRAATTILSLVVAVFVTLLLVVGAKSATAAPSSSFLIDDDFLGAKSVRKILPDGRVHVTLPTLDKAPFTAEQLKKLVKKEEDLSMLEAGEHRDDSHHISVRGTIVMHPLKEQGLFKIDTESHTDMSRLVCHDKGDKNTRVSLFAVSGKLLEWLQDPAKLPHVTLTVKDDRHVCHGDPIFRKVTAVKFVETDKNTGKYNGGEVLLITAKASYEEIFDEADVELDIKHKDLTHISSAQQTSSSNAERLLAIDGNNDHGIFDLDGNEDPAHVPVAKNKPTAASKQFAPLADRFYESQVVSKEEAYKQKFAGVPGAIVAKNKAATGVYEGKEISGMRQDRLARSQGWLKKAFKAVAKAVTKVVTKVASTVSSVANNLVKSVAKGITAVATAIRNLLTINANIDKDIGFTKDFDYTRTLYSVKFSFYFYFGAGFTFKLKIETNSLKLFHASVYGNLKVSASADLPQTTKSSSGETTLYEIQGPTINFVVYVVPVWIKVTFPILAGYELDVGYAANAGFGVTAYARYGCEYTKADGFGPVAERKFEKTYSFKYSFDIEATPWIGVQARFALYSLVTGYAYLQVGLDLEITQTDECTLLKITGDLWVRMSAGLDIELAIAGISIFSKEYGPWRIFSLSWPVINVCKDKASLLRALPAAASTAEILADRAARALENPIPEHARQKSARAASWDTSAFHNGAYIVMREAAAQAAGDNRATTVIEEQDSGKTWTTQVVCSKSQGHDYDVVYDFTFKGFFDTTNNQTIMYLVVDRNFTGFKNGIGYALTTQSSLAWFNQTVRLGTVANATLVEPNAENAQALGLSLSDLQALSDNLTIDENMTALPIDWLYIQFSSTNLEDVSFSNPNLCSPNGYGGAVAVKNIPTNATIPPPPAEGSFFGRMFAAFGNSLFPAFIRLVTDVLVVVLVLAALILVASWKLIPYLIGEHMPKRPVAPRTREYIYLAVGMSVATLCFVWFIVGANLSFAQIVGASLKPGMPRPVQQTNDSFLVASGVVTRVWDFKGAEVRSRSCLQFYPCSPDCRDLCNSTDYPSWTSVNNHWPWCPRDDDSVVLTGDQGGCTMFAFDAVINGVLTFLFVFVGCPVAIFKFDSIYRRLPGLVACLLLAGMFLSLIWRRIHSFMKETEVKLFDPVGSMIYPFSLFINSDAERCWAGACITFFVMSGLIGVVSLVEMYLFHLDVLEDRVVRYDAAFEDAEKVTGSKKPQQQAAEQSGEAHAMRDRTASAIFRAEVAADLEGKDLGASFGVNTETQESNFKSQL